VSPVIVSIGLWSLAPLSLAALFHPEYSLGLKRIETSVGEYT